MYYFSSIPGLEVIPFLGGVYRFIIKLFPFLSGYQSIIHGYMPGEFRLLVNIAREYPDMVDFILRKLAHILEFFILTVLLYLLFINLKNNRVRYALPGILSFITACFDEVHQLFIPDRHGRFIDVGIDTLGILLAFTSILLYEKIKRRRTL